MIFALLVLFAPQTTAFTGTERVGGRLSVSGPARILAAAIVALPIMAAASSIARPFGIIPRSYMDLLVLLEPFAGTFSVVLFLTGLFAAAYALLDIYNLPIKLDSRPTRIIIGLSLYIGWVRIGAFLGITG